MNTSEYIHLIDTINSMIDSILDKYRRIHPNVVIDDVTITVDGSPVDAPSHISLNPKSESLYFVEHGRGPGKFPPVDVMMDWAEKRVSLPRDIESLAYLAGRHVSLHGTDGDGKWEEITNATLSKWKPKLESALLLDFKQIEIQNIIRIKK